VAPLFEIAHSVAISLGRQRPTSAANPRVLLGLVRLERPKAGVIDVEADRTTE